MNTTPMKKRKRNKPNPEAVAQVLERYLTWLINRERNRQLARRAHWIGKRIPPKVA